MIIMEKFSRNQRVVAITKILIENPNKIINLNNFTELFNAAKSTISEDIVIVEKFKRNYHMGKIETIAGAAGGIKYILRMSKEEREEFAKNYVKHFRRKEGNTRKFYIYDRYYV